jgi:hypothetical protein
MSKRKLLDDESGSDTEAVPLRINKNYADNYETWRRKEELQKRFAFYL